MDPFLESLKRRSLELGGTRERLLAELELIETEIERLSTAADVYRSYQKRPGPASAGKPTLPEAIEAFLRERGGFGRIPDIYSALLREGQLNAKNKRSAYNQVYGTLHRHTDRFRQMGGGLWALISSEPPANGDGSLAANGVLRANGSAELTSTPPRQAGTWDRVRSAHQQPASLLVPQDESERTTKSEWLVQGSGET